MNHENMEERKRRETWAASEETWVLRRRGLGYCLEGPGFYLWDEDPQEVLRVARALRGGDPRPLPTRRMLVVPPQEVHPAPEKGSVRP